MSETMATSTKNRKHLFEAKFSHAVKADSDVRQLAAIVHRILSKHPEMEEVVKLGNAHFWLTVSMDHGWMINSDTPIKQWDSKSIEADMERLS